jgi:SulP family sulfate permease
VEVLNMAVEDENTADSEGGLKLIIPDKVEVFEVNGPFFFGVANKFEEAEKQVTRKPKIRIIRLYRVPFIDATGISNLRNFISKTQSNGIKVIISGPSKPVYEALEKNGITEMVGDENICTDIQAAISRSEKLIAQMNRTVKI